MIFPTETVYGLGANALDPVAVAKIYHAKGRPAHTPLIVHVRHKAEAMACTSVWPEEAEKLATAFWPGPLTLVLRKNPKIPGNVTAGLDTVGLRVPAHPVALALLEEVALPIAAPSANRYMELSPTMATHAARSLANAVAMVLDGGASEVGLESTVVSLASETPILLRPGAITAEQLAEVLGVPVQAATAQDVRDSHPSPGMNPRHYSPRTALRIVSPGEPLPSGSVVWLWWQTPREASASIALPSTPSGYARSLYRALHEADDMGMQLIAVESPPAHPAWLAIWDRLLRAQA